MHACIGVSKGTLVMVNAIGVFRKADAAHKLCLHRAVALSSWQDAEVHIATTP